jgi:hypothetical protein
MVMRHDIREQSALNKLNHEGGLSSGLPRRLVVVVVVVVVLVYLTTLFQQLRLYSVDF